MKKILKNTSFISTVYNEEDSIAEFLESLKGQTVLPGEIIIVDGGSSDRTFQLMEDFFNKWAGIEGSPLYIHRLKKDNEEKGEKVTVKLIKKAGAGISAGRNTAIREASGTFISVSDAGCILDPGWLEDINREMAEDHGTVNGGMNYSICRSFLQKILALSIMPGLDDTGKKGFMPSSRNICFRKSQWEEAGGYPEELDFGEDMKFDFNLMGLGHKLVFRPRAAVYWKMRKDLPGIFRQFFRYAKGDALGRMYPLRHMIRFLTGAVFMAVLLAGIFISPWLLIAFIPLGAVYCYKPFYRLFFRWEGNEGCRPSGAAKLPAILLIPLMLIFIDSAKASGYLYGLFKR